MILNDLSALHKTGVQILSGCGNCTAMFKLSPNYSLALIFWPIFQTVSGIILGVLLVVRATLGRAAGPHWATHCTGLIFICRILIFFSWPSSWNQNCTHIKWYFSWTKISISFGDFSWQKSSLATSISSTHLLLFQLPYTIRLSHHETGPDWEAVPRGGPRCSAARWPHSQQHRFTAGPSISSEFK